MSKVLINQYYSNLDRALQFGKSSNEDAIKSYFWMLLNEYAHKNNYEVVREVYCMGTRGSKVKPDGILKNIWGLDIGYWESKDEKDVIDDEIDTKIKKGYPLTNTLFEDSQMAVLFQRGEEVMRVSVREPGDLHSLVTTFISYKSEAVYRFEDALEKFKQDIPIIIETLRKRIEEAGSKNEKFINERNKFLEICKEEINPDITLADIREMMIQHLLTSDIFQKIFDDPEFHRHNTIAAELERLINGLFTYNDRRNLLGSIEHYYDAINAAAAGIADHREKQKFLKVLYENFYKVYNPKAADRLGVVYTPNEIVKFIVESTDYLLHKHFGKTLADKNVEILDPATGTGTFIYDIIEHIPKQYLKHKYQNELHANEVAILPYYIANLNIEYTFKQKMGYYEEFPNLCFVDTLDNTAPLHYSWKQETIYGMTNVNAERIRRQNSKKISVIIGNPPYNANQKNENENNKNREYSEIDARIKKTYIKNSKAQKTKMYDMYSRFYRWSMDRIDKNGVIAFITNRSFIDSRTFDGFRKSVEEDFSYAYIVDTKSDVRANPKIAGTTHNVFGIQTGVAIMFLIRKEKHDGKCRIEYVSMDDFWRKEEKLEWLRTNSFQDIEFAHIVPDKNHNWINLSENAWDNLLPLVDKDVKLGRSKEALFQLFSLGVATNRDEWVYDFDKANLIKKIQFFADFYKNERARWEKSERKTPIDKFVDRTIKWTEELESHLKKGSEIIIDKTFIRRSLYRPFTIKFTYFAQIITHRLYQQSNIFPMGKAENNTVICFSGTASSKDFQALASNKLVGLDFLEKTQCVPLYCFDSQGNRIDNITDWGIDRFRNHYQDKQIQKSDIFNYVYSVLHNPAYRKKYNLNLRREFPRIPFYADFWEWAKWGKLLMDLHINYEDIEPYPLKVISSEKKAEHKKVTAELFMANEPEALFSYKPKVKIKLKAFKEKGLIELDELTTITGIPKEAWEYKLGNRSALEWILDQYKEKKPSDPTIAEKFNSYLFADYKDKVIDLLKRVCTVSVETMKVVKEMEGVQ